jgi:hypothetical protein
MAFSRAYLDVSEGRRRLIVLPHGANATADVPAGYIIGSITIENYGGNAITGGLKIGTTSGGEEVLAAYAVAGSTLYTVADALILKRFFSVSASTVLYFQPATSWNSATVQITIPLDRVNS